MDNVKKENLVREIDELFAEFYATNMCRFRLQFPSMVVDGNISPYVLCMPQHIFARLDQN